MGGCLVVVCLYVRDVGVRSALIMIVYVLNMTVFVLLMTACVLNMNVFVLSDTLFVLRTRQRGN